MAVGLKSKRTRSTSKSSGTWSSTRRVNHDCMRNRRRKWAEAIQSSASRKRLARPKKQNTARPMISITTTQICSPLWSIEINWAAPRKGNGQRASRGAGARTQAQSQRSPSLRSTARAAASAITQSGRRTLLFSSSSRRHKRNNKETGRTFWKRRENKH